MTSDLATSIPRSLSSYSDPQTTSLVQLLWGRIQAEPFNAIATTIFLLAICHTFAAVRIGQAARSVQLAHDRRAQSAGLEPRPAFWAEFLHLLGEVEVVFGLWAVALLVAFAAYAGWGAATHYLNDTVDYTEPLFVVVIMAMSATRPIVVFAESALRQVARLGGATPAAWWFAILTIGPMLGSFLTEPAAMTICALLLGRQFYDLQPGSRLKYATLGLLFVNVSIGGTLTHFAAPPVLMVARPWQWDLAFILLHVGWRAAISIGVSTSAYFLLFRTELTELGRQPSVPDTFEPDEPKALTGDLLPIPTWIIAVHVAFMVWIVMNAHYPALFIGGFLIFLGFARATAEYQSRIELKGPLLVGFFLGGLVIHGGLQSWWIAPVLERLTEEPLFWMASFLTSFNDNAMITYLATLVPDLHEASKIAVLQGAVTGGGLTVIANAPNPAGQAILSEFFDDAVSPVGLLIGALLPTLIAALCFRAF